MKVSMFLNRYQTNKYNSWTCIIGVCEPLTEIISLNPKFSANYTEFKGNCAQILTKAVKRNDLNKGIGDVMTAAREKIIRPVFVNAGIVCNMGDDTNRPEISAKSKITMSQLKRYSAISIYEFGMQIRGLMSDNLEELAEYLITQPELGEFDSKLEEYKVKTGKVSSQLSESQALTKQIDLLFKRNNILLSKMDIYVERLKESNNDFYLAYKEARKIFDRGGTINSETPAEPPVTPS